MTDQTAQVSIPNTDNADDLRVKTLEGLGKARLRTILRVAAAGTTLAGDADEVWADLTVGSFSIDLPAAPVDGDTYEFNVEVASGNTLTIGRNGNNINGAAADATISTQWAGLTLTWSSAANTWWSR